MRDIAGVSVAVHENRAGLLGGEPGPGEFGAIGTDELDFLRLVGQRCIPGGRWNKDHFPFHPPAEDEEETQEDRKYAQHANPQR